MLTESMLSQGGERDELLGDVEQKPSGRKLLSSTAEDGQAVCDGIQSNLERRPGLALVQVQLVKLV